MKNKEVTQKSGVDFTHRGQADILMLRMDPDSALHCDGCKDFLGIWHSVRYAMFKKKGSEYYVPCKKCGGLNKRVKGELGRKLDERWVETK
jgi:hypothetical protein